MVLDAKSMPWAEQNGIDTAKLKAARLPIYGKWYFPELPLNTTLVNLATGERRTFPGQQWAGEILWVKLTDLKRAGLGNIPEEESGQSPPTGSGALPAELIAAREEPMLAISRPPSGATDRTPEKRRSEVLAVLPRPVQLVVDQASDRTAPVLGTSATIAPLVVGLGLCLALVGAITSLLIVLVGCVWILVGGIAWVRVSALETQWANPPDPTQPAHNALPASTR